MLKISEIKHIIRQYTELVNLAIAKEQQYKNMPLDRRNDVIVIFKAKLMAYHEVLELEYKV